MLRYLKRLLAVLLVASLSILSVSSATAGTVEDALIANMKNVYKKALTLAGRNNFDGLCGLCTGRQLQAAGVFNKYVGSDGNGSYSKYKSSKPSSGVSVTAFPGKYQSGSYTIKQICNLLNEVNINGENTYAAFCFDTGWGEEGKKYGHVMLVHAVYKGKVYWAESFGQSTRVDTIANFASYYAENSKGEKRFDGAVVFGYKELQGNQNVPVSDIVVNGNYYFDIYVGESFIPMVEVKPDNATNKAYTLTSSDPNIVQVYSDGSIYAVSPGDCWITATAKDGSGVSGSILVTVRAVYVPAEAIAINDGYDVSLAQGDWWYPTVNVYPYNATDRGYHLQSSTPDVLRVYEDGWVEAVSPGRSLLYAYTSDYSAYSYIYVDVYEPFIPVEKIVLENDMYGDIAYTGESRWLVNVEVYPANATDPSYYITSSDPNVASISYYGYDAGIHWWQYTCHTPGSTQITAAANDGSGVSASFWLYVLESTVPVESIVVTNEKNTLRYGEPYDILWEVYPENATNKAVSWTNSNDQVVWLLTAEEGFVEVYCVGCGDTMITVSANDGSGVTYSFPLTVQHVYVEVTTTKPTCTENGVKTFTCSKCNQSYTESIPAFGHAEVIDTAVAATCTANGWTEGKHCGTCGTVIVAQTEVPAKGHIQGGKVVINEATNVLPGLARVSCTICGITLYEEEIPALGIPRIAGDADEDGEVTISDALLILQYDVDRNVAINTSNADVNADGTVDIHDALLILQYIAGWNVTLR